MNYFNKLSLPVALIIPFVVACSSSHESLKQAELDFDYIEIEATDDILLPEGVEAPAYSHEYTIPEQGDEARKTYIGEKVDVRSPSLVLPILSDSRVEQRKGKVILWIDIPDDNHHMEAMLWAIIKGYLASENREIESFSQEDGFLDTKWYELSNDKENENSHAVYNLKQRYQYNVLVKPHGRTVGISAKLIGYQQQVVEAGAWNEDISAIDSQRYSVQALNKLILFFDSNQKEYQAKFTASKPNTLGADAQKVNELGVAINEDNEEIETNIDAGPFAPNIMASSDFEGNVPLIILDAPFSTIGPALRASLLIMGFEVKTVIAVDGYVTLKYEAVAPQELDDFDIQPLTLESGSYQLMVGDLVTKTSLLFSNSEGRVLEEWKVVQLLNHLVPLMDRGVYSSKVVEK